MTLYLYAVEDKLVGFMNPFVMQNDSQALRSFKMTVNAQDNNPIAKCPSDMSLWRLASFDEKDGAIVADKQKLADASAVKEVQQ